MGWSGVFINTKNNILYVSIYQIIQISGKKTGMGPKVPFILPVLRPVSLSKFSSTHVNCPELSNEENVKIKRVIMVSFLILKTSHSLTFKQVDRCHDNIAPVGHLC